MSKNQKIILAKFSISGPSDLRGLRYHVFLEFCRNYSSDLTETWHIDVKKHEESNETIFKPIRSTVQKLLKILWFFEVSEGFLWPLLGFYTHDQNENWHIDVKWPGESNEIIFELVRQRVLKQWRILRVFEDFCRYISASITPIKLKVAIQPKIE